MKIKNCYLYVYTDPTKPGKFSYPDLNVSFLYEPFYVGKGSRKRMFHHIVEAKRRNKTKKQKKIISILDSGIDPKDYIIKIKDNLSDEEAYVLEEQMIQCIGRALIKQGPLLNLHPGGRGAYHGFTSKLSRKDKLEVKKMYLNGDSVAKISDHYAVSKPAIHRALHDTDSDLVLRRRSKLTEQEVNQISSLYESGISVGCLIDKYRVSRSEIYRILRRSVPKIIKYSNKSAERLRRLECYSDEIVAKYTAGVSFSELEELFGASSVLISRILKSNGIAIKQQSTTKELELKIVKLYEEGYTIPATALSVGLSYNGTRNVLIRNGVRIRPKGGKKIN